MGRERKSRVNITHPLTSFLKTYLFWRFDDSEASSIHKLYLFWTFQVGQPTTYNYENWSVYNKNQCYISLISYSQKLQIEEKGKKIKMKG